MAQHMYETFLSATKLVPTLQVSLTSTSISPRVSFRSFNLSGASSCEAGVKCQSHARLAKT